MGNMTISVPDGLLKELKKYSYIKWSEVVRISLNQKIKDIKKIDLYKDLKDAEENYNNGKSISLKQLKKELGFEDL
jgi:hypothetical protein